MESDSWSAPYFTHPEDNAPTAERIALGKRLFFDPIMSADYSISCASCHMPEFAFSDTVAFSTGAAGAAGVRNAPTLTNVAHQPYFLRDGGVPTLEMQVLVPIQEHNEFDMNILEIAERMNNDSSYIAQALAAYNRQPDPFVITRSLANYERTLISDQSRYDLYKRQPHDGLLTALEKEGMDLFFSERTACASCHSGFDFTDFSFKNTGLYVHYPDSGKIRLTLKETDRGLFKVPSLRNLSYTAPYMHDGSMETLEAVINHYSEGIRAHENLSAGVKNLNLELREKKALVAFLRTLDDDSFVQRHGLASGKQAEKRSRDQTDYRKSDQE